MQQHVFVSISLLSQMQNQFTMCKFSCYIYRRIWFHFSSSTFVCCFGWAISRLFSAHPYVIHFISFHSIWFASSRQRVLENGPNLIGFPFELPTIINSIVKTFSLHFLSVLLWNIVKIYSQCRRYTRMNRTIKWNFAYIRALYLFS